VGAGGKSAADGHLDLAGPQLAAEHQDVDHLPRRLLAADAFVDCAPELIEALRPIAAVALLAQRQGACQRSWLSAQQVEVVLQLGGGTVAAGEPLVGGDDLAVMPDRELPGADLRPHLHPRQSGGDRVAVLADRHHRL
jgi:hypothetical protein